MDYYGTETLPNYSSNAISEETNKSLLSRVFNLMGIGLGISGIFALLGEHLILNRILPIEALFVFAIVEIILVIAMTAGIQKMSGTTAKLCFLAYSAVNGVTLSTLLLVYTAESVFTTFLITGATFFAASLYGKTTKKNVASMGGFLVMGLFGLIIAGIINIFLRSNLLEFGITVIGILIFIGLTIYDVNRIKEMANLNGIASKEDMDKIASWGALQLYLDFINLFIKLIRIFGKSRSRN